MFSCAEVITYDQELQLLSFAPAEELQQLRKGALKMYPYAAGDDLSPGLASETFAEFTFPDGDGYMSN